MSRDPSLPILWHEALVVTRRIIADNRDEGTAGQNPKTIQRATKSIPVSAERLMRIISSLQSEQYANAAEWLGKSEQAVLLTQMSLADQETPSPFERIALLWGSGRKIKSEREPQGYVLDPGIAEAATSEKLTPRQAEVLDLVKQGQANRAVAERLGISEATVKDHMRQIRRKLFLHRVDAAAVAQAAAAEATVAVEDGAVFTLGEAEWLEAELLALRQEALARSESLDATLAYVTERCAAVGRS